MGVSVRIIVSEMLVFLACTYIIVAACMLGGCLLLRCMTIVKCYTYIE